MARYITHPSARSLIAGGAIAGIIGGCIFHAFLFAIGRAHFPSTYEWIASGLLGDVAYDGSLAWAGILIHFAIAIVAATIYAYVAQVVGLLGRPFVGTLVLGIAMNGVMDLVKYVRWDTPLPTTWPGIGVLLLAHVVFFAAPIAFFLSKYERVPVPYA
ncbi:MAG: hypothetical protein ACREMP_03605 [Candidatus Tyrphobacter sp.]